MAKQDFDGEHVARVLDYLGRELEPSVLIGGWATRALVGGEISRDIDLIVGEPSLRSRLREKLDDYSENRHQNSGMKVRGSVQEVHVDAYIPHESLLGSHLLLDVAEIVKHVGPEELAGWRLLRVEAHLVTKFAALLDRPDSEKGAKDAREISALLKLNHDLSEAIKILRAASARSDSELMVQLTRLFELLPDRAGFNKSARREFHQLRREWLDEFERQVRREPRVKN